MTSKNKLLTILSDIERYALYGLPDFDDGQQFEYLSLSEAELALACSRPSLYAQVYCVLQIGYFKAKHAFFRFTWDEVQEDCVFVLSHYFNGQVFKQEAITKHERYTQRTLITELFGYRLWSSDFLPQLAQQSAQIVRRDVTSGFIVAELIAWLNEHKIVRPGYTTLQKLISDALSAERQRLSILLASNLDDTANAALGQLLVRDDTLSELAALKQDAKDFGWRQMAKERAKLSKLKPLYQIAKILIPKMAISQQNLHYYASLANFYTIYDLRHLEPPEQAHLYLLSYIWLRYRQITDNLVDAMRISEQIENVDRVLIHYEPIRKDNLVYALPLQDNRHRYISDHFGDAPCFALITVKIEDGRIIKQEILANPFTHVNQGKGIMVAEFLIKHAVDVVITREGFAGKGPFYVFSNAAVDTLQTEQDTPEKALKKLGMCRE